jgi:serine phosphatase RsbU (regulator of sigma subunit)
MKSIIIKTGLLLFMVSTLRIQAEEGKPKRQQPSAVELAKLMKGKTPEQQIFSYDSLSGLYINNDAAFALKCSNKALELAGDKENKVVGHSLSNRAKALKQLSEYDKALADIDRAYAIYLKLNDKPWMVSLLIDYGNLFYMTGDYDKSLTNYLKAMKLSEEIEDVKTEAMCVNNIGNIYFYQQKFDKAIEFYQKAYSMNKKLNDSMKVALSLDNIGLVYIEKEEYDMALLYQVSALNVVERLDDKKFLAEVLMNLGVVNQEMKKYPAALKYFERAAKIYEEVGSRFGLAGCLVNVGDNYRLQKRFNESTVALNQAMEIFENIGAKNGVKEAAETLSQTYEDMGQPDKALKYYKIFSRLKDSIFTVQTAGQIDELSAKYETAKKQKEIELLTKENDLSDIRLKQKDTLAFSLFIGIALALSVMGLVFYRYQEKRKANVLLAEKNIAIHEQKELVDEKNKEITDSINYARRIQDAMLPSKRILDEYFKENFIFYQPKDIISGDFYWALRKDDQLYVAAADCTGHGVPGALMSMIGVTFLRQIINEMNITDTAEILNKLHLMVVAALNEDVSKRDSKDGMDVSLLKIDIVNKKAQFSGAVRPLYILGKDGLEIIKGDRFSIGGIKTMEETFSSTSIDLNGGRSFYLFSDGFPDQFGQESGKKFMIKRLQKTIEESHKLPMDEQHKQFSDVFNKWKGTLDQTDDVLLIGIRV